MLRFFLEKIIVRSRVSIVGRVLCFFNVLNKRGVVYSRRFFFSLLFFFVRKYIVIIRSRFAVVGKDWNFFSGSEELFCVAVL